MSPIIIFQSHLWKKHEGVEEDWVCEEAEHVDMEAEVKQFYCDEAGPVPGRGQAPHIRPRAQLTPRPPPEGFGFRNEIKKGS